MSTKTSDEDVGPGTRPEHEEEPPGEKKECPHSVANIRTNLIFLKNE